MGEVKWIKITTNMFEDEKIDFIDSLPEADTILIIWVKLLTLAGKCNANGFIFLTEKIPYTDEMLAHKFRRPLSTVKMALEVLRRLDMIDFEKGYLKIVNWEKHQNIQGLERIREQTRLRVAKHRELKKLQNECNETVSCNVTGNVTVTPSNATDIDLDKDIDKERDLYKTVVDLYLENCPSLPKIIKLNTNRKTLIKARYKEHGIDGLETLFKKAEASDFLSGRNGKWTSCNFDWLLKDSNCLKVLEGNYDNSASQKPITSKDFSYSEPPAQNKDFFSFLEEGKNDSTESDFGKSCAD